MNTTTKLTMMRRMESLMTKKGRSMMKRAKSMKRVRATSPTDHL